MRFWRGRKGIVVGTVNCVIRVWGYNRGMRRKIGAIVVGDVLVTVPGSEACVRRRILKCSNLNLLRCSIKRMGLGCSRSALSQGNSYRVLLQPI